MIKGTTIEQFMNSRRDLDEHRTGWDVLPDKAQSAEITRRALAAGIKESALPDVFDAYTGHNGKRTPEFDLNDFDLWIEHNKLAREHIFTTPDSYALAAAAFSENGVLNLSARSRLVLEVGEQQAESMARQWGLNGLQDFRTKGVRPDPADKSINAEAARLEAEIAQRQAQLANIRKAAPEPEVSSNPFTRLIRSDGTRDPAAEKHVALLIVAVGTKKAAEIAASAKPPRTIDGRVIAEKFR